MPTRLAIVTGMSGAGKSTALRVLEDAGYFCVDNLPIPLIEKLVTLAFSGGSGKMDRVALGVDIRSGEALPELQEVLELLGMTGISYEILFLDAGDDILIKRYKETRRLHPLSGTGRVESGIARERQALAFLKKQADYIIDTSQLLTRELKQELENIFVRDGHFKNLMITVLSFGFKYGIPADADLVFDVRFMPNPFYIEDLRHQTGLDKAVADYVFHFPQTQDYMKRLEDLLAFSLPLYAEEGKTSLTIAVGCTGGHHRSVAVTHALAGFIREQGYQALENHRDMMRGG